MPPPAPNANITQREEKGKSNEVISVEEKKKMGRPPLQGESRTEKLNLRLTKAEKEEIEYCSEKLNLTRTDTIMKGIGLVKKELEE